MGLAMADGAVMLTGVGQPALLYLVPCTLGLTLALSSSRGDLGWMWRGVAAGENAERHERERLLPD